MTNAQPCEGLGAVGIASESLGRPEDATPAARPVGPFTQQKWRVIHRLADGKMTAWDGYRDLGISCLRSHIAHLQAVGVVVAREWWQMPTRHGRTQAVCRYWIEPGEYARIRASAGGAA
jgi:hypothetical protein